MTDTQPPPHPTATAGRLGLRPVLLGLLCVVLGVVAAAVLLGGPALRAVPLDRSADTYEVAVCVAPGPQYADMVDIEFVQDGAIVQRSTIQAGGLITASVPAGAQTRVLVDGRPYGVASAGAGGSVALTGAGCPSP